VIALQAANVPRVYLNGSFVTAKEEPADFDACWDYDDQTNFDALEPLFWHPEFLAFPRLGQKARFGGEVFPAAALANEEGTTYRDFFQRDKNSHQPKGIIVFDLRSEEL